MQQRQPRLGDVVDDYCPRERRVTNHAVVAMVGDEVKQTRCTTCDAEHEYKQARVPPQRKKKDVPGALYQQVLDGLPRVVPTADDEAEPEVLSEPDQDVEAAILAAGDADGDADADGNVAGEPEGPVHRRLIRATLPKLPGAEPPARREPEFTIRAPGQRPGKQRNGFRGQRPGGMQGQSPGNANGNRAGKRHGRPGGGDGQGGWSRPGQPGGHRGQGGHRQGQGQGQGRGGKKRSR
jgi:hypothetical protein